MVVIATSVGNDVGVEIRPGIDVRASAIAGFCQRHSVRHLALVTAAAAIMICVTGAFVLSVERPVQIFGLRGNLNRNANRDGR
jgi:hypothetical protein